jgi:hypothetical protein
MPVGEVGCPDLELVTQNATFGPYLAAKIGCSSLRSFREHVRRPGLEEPNRTSGPYLAIKIGHVVLI